MIDNENSTNEDTIVLLKLLPQLAACVDQACRSISEEVNRIEVAEEDATDDEDEDCGSAARGGNEDTSIHGEEQPHVLPGSEESEILYRQFQQKIKKEIEEYESEFLDRLTNKHADIILMGEKNLNICEASLEEEITNSLMSFECKFKDISELVGVFKDKMDNHAVEASNSKRLQQRLHLYTNSIMITQNLIEKLTNERVKSILNSEYESPENKQIMREFETALIDLEKKIAFTDGPYRLIDTEVIASEAYPSCTESKKQMLSIRNRCIDNIRQGLGRRIEKLRTPQLNVSVYQQALLNQTGTFFDYLQMFHPHSARILGEIYCQILARSYSEKFSTYLNDITQRHPVKMIRKVDVGATLRSLGLMIVDRKLVEAFDLSRDVLRVSSTILNVSNPWNIQSERASVISSKFEASPILPSYLLPGAADSPLAEKDEGSTSNNAPSTSGGASNLPLVLSQSWVMNTIRGISQNSSIWPEEKWRSLYRLIVDTSSHESSFDSEYFKDGGIWKEIHTKSSAGTIGRRRSADIMGLSNASRKTHPLSDIQIFSNIFSPILDIVETELMKDFASTFDISFLCLLVLLMNKFYDQVQLQAPSVGMLRLQIVNCIRRCLNLISACIGLLGNAFSLATEEQIRAHILANSQSGYVSAAGVVRLACQGCAFICKHLSLCKCEGVSTDSTKRAILTCLGAIERWINVGSTCIPSAESNLIYCIRVWYEVHTPFGELMPGGAEPQLGNDWVCLFSSIVSRAKTAYVNSTKSYVKGIVHALQAEILEYHQNESEEYRTLELTNSLVVKLNGRWQSDLALMSSIIDHSLEDFDDCSDVLKEAFSAYMMIVSRFHHLVTSLESLDKTQLVPLVPLEKIMTEIRRFYP